MGEYKTPQEVTGAVNDFMAKKQQSWRLQNCVVKTTKPYQLGQLG
jgi:hypothetical protein